MPDNVNDKIDNNFDMPDNANDKIDNNYDLPDNINDNIDNNYDMPDNINDKIDNNFDMPDNANDKIDNNYDMPDNINDNIDNYYDMPDNINAGLEIRGCPLACHGLNLLGATRSLQGCHQDNLKFSNKFVISKFIVKLKYKCTTNEFEVKQNNLHEMLVKDVTKGVRGGGGHIQTLGGKFKLILV